MDVERRYARKAYYNARGVVGLRCNLNLRHYYKTHCSAVVFSYGAKRIVCFTIVCASVPERPNGADCKSVDSLVQIQPDAPDINNCN